MKLLPLALGVFLTAHGVAAARQVAEFPMEVTGGNIYETVTGDDFRINGNFSPMSVASPSGTAWRTDGYTSHIPARVGDIINGPRMSAQLVFAVDTYPIIAHDSYDANNTMVEVATCLDVNRRCGFAFMMGRTGRYAFRTFVGGEDITLSGAGIIPLWEWNSLQGIVDGREVRLYLNGSLVASASAASEGVKICDAELLIGRARDNNSDWCGARTADFNGAIDLIRIADDAEVTPYTSAYADLNLPESRYETDRLRARFHGQPGMNWTNETHGLFYNPGDGRYHVFFQRTGSAPVMSHQHWGHIVSDNLYEWHDEKPALAPGENYDLRGCWSGCVFSDEVITGGKPAILYTGVNYDNGNGKSYAAIANCDDTGHLRYWSKDTRNPIVDEPGIDRDTYFFRKDADNAYMIIGADNRIKLYRYDNGSWTPRGNFYTSTSDDQGFTEMPNVTRLDNGKWLMTTTPWNPADGVVCLYRTGDIDSEGRFSDFSGVQKFDLFARNGYGLMSPSFGRDKDGRLIALGIVADKMPTSFNLSHGYAHLYSLPREISVDENGNLCQKPFAGAEAMRGAVGTRLEPMTLDGAVNLAPVRGRQAEISATFTVADAVFGFNFFKDAAGRAASLSYNPSNHELKVDFGRISRETDVDNISSFSAILPVAPAKGEEMKLRMFIDHSILDIFVNDQYAASVRVFPSDDKAEIIEVFSDGPTALKSLEAYMLGDGDVSGDPVIPEEPEVLDSTGKFALYVGFDSEDALRASSVKEEIAVYDFFKETYPGADVIFTGDLSRLSAESYDCVWINFDRREVIKNGKIELPEAYGSQEVVDRLRQYLADGGNLYLTKHATQLAHEIRPAIPAPGVIGDGEGARHEADDPWRANITHNGMDYTRHPVFSGIPTVDAFGMTMIDLLTGANTREDHNAMWAMGENGHDPFCRDNNARVLATWGHNAADAMWHAGIVEFMPLTARNLEAISPDKAESRRGTIIANGLAACEWRPADGENASLANLRTLSSNVLAYLSPRVEDNGGNTALDRAASPETSAPEYYNLHGMRVRYPMPGQIYICRRGTSVTKVIF